MNPRPIEDISNSRDVGHCTQKTRFDLVTVGWIVTLYVFLVSLGKNKSVIKPSPGMICVHLLVGQIVLRQIETFKTLNFNKGDLVYKFHWYDMKNVPY